MLIINDYSKTLPQMLKQVQHDNQCFVAIPQPEPEVAAMC